MWARTRRRPTPLPAMPCHACHHAARASYTHCSTDACCSSGGARRRRAAAAAGSHGSCWLLRWRRLAAQAAYIRLPRRPAAAGRSAPISLCRRHRPKLAGKYGRQDICTRQHGQLVPARRTIRRVCGCLRQDNTRRSALAYYISVVAKACSSTAAARSAAACGRRRQPAIRRR